jgi:hypothetical protein
MLRIFCFITLFALQSQPLFGQAITLVSGLASPTYIAFHEGELYISEEFSGNILKLDSTTTPLSTTLVKGGFFMPGGLAFNGNDLYLAESGNNQVLKFDVTSSPIIVDTVVRGLNFPTALAIHDNYLYIAQSVGNKVSRLDITSVTPVLETVTTDVVGPTGLAFLGNELCIASALGEVKKYNMSVPVPFLQDVVTKLSSIGDIAIDSNELFITNRDGFDIYRKYITTNSTATVSDTVYTYSSLRRPIGLAILGHDLYIAEKGYLSFYDGAITKLANVLSVEENTVSVKRPSLFPNPASDVLHISGILADEEYTIWSASGLEVDRGYLSEDNKIPVNLLPAGFYVIQFGRGSTIKFTKK